LLRVDPELGLVPSNGSNRTDDFRPKEVPGEPTLLSSADQPRGSYENGDPPGHKSQGIEDPPYGSGPFQRKPTLSRPTEEKQIHHIGCWAGADIKTKEYTDNTIDVMGAGERRFIIEQAAVSGPEQNQNP
jgi:hypothetical protein